MAKTRSFEDDVVDWCKDHLDHFFNRTESINPEIDNALKIAPSKQGGNGPNFPDLKCLITLGCRNIPVMIECKGTKGDFIKQNKNGDIILSDKSGNPDYTTIAKYAVNGAIHYANAILNHTESYKEVIAIGANGWEVNGQLKTELGVYLLSKENLFIPKKVDDYSDLSFLNEKNIKGFVEKIDELKLTPEEIESKKFALEDEIEIRLKRLNQTMHDDLQITVESRVKLIAGMIMAGLGVENISEGLKIEDLKGEKGKKSNDGQKIIDKIEDFLKSKNLPEEKQEVILNELANVFKNTSLYTPQNGESKLKTVFTVVKSEILPFLSSDLHNIDFTGRLFNVLNDWVAVPDGAENDVVLTPRAVTELMTKLTQVNKDSYVWDYATGSAGFLISAMHHMIDDAKKKIKNPDEQRKKIATIKAEQLLGIEKLPEIYILAVLNMILMGDGSSNIIHADSLKDFSGKYEQGQKKGQEFPANVFLLNPPYSAAGKGFVFVEKALSKMKSGKAAVLIKENAGSNKGDGYPAEILKHSTLLASIHMNTDLFIGKSNVQTAIYVFDVGIPHDIGKLVKFIDFSNDGYARQNRKTSSQKNNLKNVDHAKERYAEIVDLVVRGKGKDDKNLNYYKDCYVEDYITLEGNDWTYSQHKLVESKPNENEIQAVIKDFYSWKIENFIRTGSNQGINESNLLQELSEQEIKCMENYANNKVYLKEVRLGDFFDIHPTKCYRMTNDELLKNKGTVPFVANSSGGNGIGGWVNLEATEAGNIITFSDTTTSEAIFYQPYDFIGYPHVQGLYKKKNIWDENSLMFLVATFRKCASGRFDYTNKFNREIAMEMKVSLPIKSSVCKEGGLSEESKISEENIDFEFLKHLIKAHKKIAIKPLKKWFSSQDDDKSYNVKTISFGGFQFNVPVDIAADTSSKLKK